MKNILAFITSLFLFCHCVSAQDTITLNSGVEIRAKIINVNKFEVRYKRFDIPKGQTYILWTSRIHSIQYENGTKDIFSDSVSQPLNTKEIFRDSVSQLPDTKERFRDSVSPPLDTLVNKFNRKFLKLNFTLSFLYSEAGIAYDIPGKKRKNFAEVSLSYIPYNYNAGEESFGTVGQTWNGRGFIFKLSSNTITRSHEKSLSYFSLRIAFRQLYFSRYCHPDGSSGLSSTIWYDQTEEKSTLLLNAIWGRIYRLDSKFKVKTFMAFGFGSGQSTATRYNYCRSINYLYPYGNPKTEVETFFYPSIDLGITLSYDLLTR